jgi:SAM-dependent methyltransferase
MDRQGWRVLGVDISPSAVARVRRELGLPVVLGTLPHPRLKAASFDLVSMWQSLEHVHDPRTVLEEAYRLLVPGGQLLIAAPNIDGLPFSWFGPAWNGLDLPRHLVHFTPATLHRMVERAGFHVRSSRMVRHSRWLRDSARIERRGGAGGSWLRNWMRLKQISRLAAWYAAIARRSDCMLVTAER